MTREEAIKQLKDNRVLCIDSETEPFAIAYDLAIKALEQELFINKPCVSAKICEHDKYDVLNKIRAEMLEEMLSHSGTGEEVIQAYVDGLKKGLQIIDKYKGESEG